MLRFDKLTVKAQEALQAAQEIGARQNQQQIEPLHLLAALVEQKEGVVPPLLGKLGVPAETLSAEISRRLDRFPKVSGVAQQFLSPTTNQLVEHAFEEAARFKDEYVSTEHLLLAIAACRATLPVKSSPNSAPVTTPFCRHSLRCVEASA